MKIGKSTLTAVRTTLQAARDTGPDSWPGYRLIQSASNVQWRIVAPLFSRYE